jgi:hypothetical protein
VDQGSWGARLVRVYRVWGQASAGSRGIVAVGGLGEADCFVVS